MNYYLRLKKGVEADPRRTAAPKLKTKKGGRGGGRGGVENLLAFPRFVAEAVLLVTPRQANRCEQRKEGRVELQGPPPPLAESPPESTLWVWGRAVNSS